MKQVPQFTTNRIGAAYWPFLSSTDKGGVIADFILTTCESACPRMSL